MSVQATNDDISPWQKTDNEWFDANQSRSYRIRQGIPGEPVLKRFNGILPDNCWVVVRKIMRRSYTGIVFISKYPLPDNEFHLCNFYERNKRMRSTSVLNGRTIIVMEE